MKHRLPGKRRIFQSMGFRLRTHKLPRDTQSKINLYKRRKRNRTSMMHNRMLRKGFHGQKEAESCTRYQDFNKVVEAFFTPPARFLGPEIAFNIGGSLRHIITWEGFDLTLKEHVPEEESACPSKFLTMCLYYIQNALQLNRELSDDDDCRIPFFANYWGLEFWNCHYNGIDVFEIDRADSTLDKIAWVVSTAAERLTMKEREGVSTNAPSLLYLVPSIDKIHKVNGVCKPLEAVGIHTMCLNSEVPLYHQIHDLKRNEPEFLISTPDRLLKLLKSNAVDISEISLLVIDGVEAAAPCKNGFCFETINCIRQFIVASHQTLVFSKHGESFF